MFVTGYFLFVMLPPEFWSDAEAWKETLLAGRFAARTSAGVLFSMLAAAGLGAMWMFRKLRVLAIFDDLDTVMMMVPLKMLMVGIAWQLGLSVVLMALLLVIAYVWLHRVPMPVTWRWVLLYAAVIAVSSDLIYAWGKLIDPTVPVHIEVLLPAFVLGCLARPGSKDQNSDTMSPEEALHNVVEWPTEKKASFVVSAAFMVFVGRMRNTRRTLPVPCMPPPLAVRWMMRLSRAARKRGSSETPSPPANPVPGWARLRCT